MVAAFIAELLNDGKEAATARARQLALRRFANGAGRARRRPTRRLKPPKLDSKVVPVLSAQQHRALLAPCHGPELRDRRNEALVRLLSETGLRAGETIGLRAEDVDLRAGTLHVRRGKGGKGRLVPFGPQTARALTAIFGFAGSTASPAPRPLWLGDRGRGFGYDALHFALGRRAEAKSLNLGDL